jgi:hypothetical protein
MLSFRTKDPDLGKFWRALDGKMLIYFMAIWNILRTFGIFYEHLVHFVFFRYIFQVLVLCTQKNLATLIGTIESIAPRYHRFFFSALAFLSGLFL